MVWAVHGKGDESRHPHIWAGLGEAAGQAWRSALQGNWGWCGVEGEGMRDDAPVPGTVWLVARECGVSVPSPRGGIQGEGPCAQPDAHRHPQGGCSEGQAGGVNTGEAPPPRRSYCDYPTQQAQTHPPSTLSGSAEAPPVSLLPLEDDVVRGTPRSTALEPMELDTLLGKEGEELVDVGPCLRRHPHEVHAE